MPKKRLHAFTIKLMKLFFCRKKIFVCKDFDNCLCSCSKKKLVINCMHEHAHSFSISQVMQCKCCNKMQVKFTGQVKRYAQHR